MYKQCKDSFGNIANCIKRTTDGAFIPVNPDNQDFVEYQKWLNAGNTPLPADEPNA